MKDFLFAKMVSGHFTVDRSGQLYKVGVMYTILYISMKVECTQ